MLYLATSDTISFLEQPDVRPFVSGYIELLKGEHLDIFEELAEEKEISSELKKRLDGIAEDYKRSYISSHSKYSRG